MWGRSPDCSKAPTEDPQRLVLPRLGPGHTILFPSSVKKEVALPRPSPHWPWSLNWRLLWGRSPPAVYISASEILSLWKVYSRTKIRLCLLCKEKGDSNVHQALWLCQPQCSSGSKHVHLRRSPKLKAWDELQLLCAGGMAKTAASLYHAPSYRRDTREGMVSFCPWKADGKMASSHP